MRLLHSLRYLFIFILLTSVTAEERPIASGKAHVLYSDDGDPSPALLSLLSYFNVAHRSSWESILIETQKNWLQKGERWTFPMIDDSAPQKTYALFSSLGMTETFAAQKDSYRHAVVLGALLDRVRVRLAFLKHEWERGVRFYQLVFLTGDRPLDPQLEGQDQLLQSPFPLRQHWKPPASLPRNETEMMRFVFEQMDLPEEWRHLPLMIIDTPAAAGKSRPNTEETFVAWLKENPPSLGPILVVSNQPFIGRQDTIARHFLCPALEVDTVGPGFTFREYQQEQRGLAILLDELARWLYQEAVYGSIQQK